MRQPLIRLLAISVALVALASLRAPVGTTATPTEGAYVLVRDVKAANFPQMSGIALIPNAPDEAVVITQDGLLWRISLSGAFSPVAFGDMAHCPDGLDDDGDTRANDGCPTFGATFESGSNCADSDDDDGDGYVNDGCGSYDPVEAVCNDATDNEGDGYVNDGCVASGASEASLSDPLAPPYECADAVDDDADTLINDGCPTFTPTERRVLLGGEEGLIGIAFSPDYANDDRVYLYYTPPINNPSDPTNYCCHNRLSRFQVTDNTLDITTEAVILDTEDREPWHAGGQLVFGPDGYLYVGRGDEGWVGDIYGNAQNTNVLYGKILRINVTGQSTYTIPPDNPFVGGPGADEIWAYGFRNPWRLSFDSATGDLWAGDVGQFAWEEADKIVAGGNCGWDWWEGNHCYEAPPNCSSPTYPPDYVAPRAEFCHPQWVSTCPGWNGAAECAIIGGFVYHGALMPELDGWYIYGDYCSGKIWAVDTASASSPPVLLMNSAYNISTFFERPDGEALVLTFNKAIYRLAPDIADDDGDGLSDVGEGDCGGDVDNDGNGVINDGCPAVGAAEIEQCRDIVDQDGDTTVNDGCPAVGPREADGTPSGGPNCAGAVDNDGDAYPNDGCPAVSSSEIGQCSTREESLANDSDGDGWINDGCPGFTEAVGCGSDHLDPASVPERIDTAGDDDGDGQTNESLPAGAEVYDCDGDGFTGTAEAAVVTNAQDPCGNNGWPAELAGNDNTLNIGDLNSFVFPLRTDGSFNKFNHPVPDPDDANIARWNLDSAGGGAAIINIGDINALNPAVNSPTSRPPMFGGQPAFFTNSGVCPYPP